MPSPNAISSLNSTKEKLRFLRGHLRWILAWAVAALILSAIGWYLLFANLNVERQQTETAALRETATLARSYADQLTRTIEAVDQILLHVKFEWELSQGKLDLSNIRSKGLFPPSSVFNVSIIDRDGRLLTSGVPNPDEVDLKDRQYFQIHKNAAKDQLFISPPVISRVSNRRVILFSRRLETKDGSFNGIALVSVVPGYFTANYDEVTLGGHGFLGIVGDDQMIRTTRTGQTVHGADSPALVSSPRFPTRNGSEFLDGDAWFADHRGRFVGWQAVDNYSLTAMTGLDQQTALSAYRVNRAAVLRQAIWATVALAILTCIAMAFSIRLAWRKYQLDLTQSAYRMATEGGSEGFYIARPIRDANHLIVDFEIIDSNRRGAEFLLQRREELIGKRISTLYEGANPERLLGMLRLAMEKGVYESDVEVPGDSPLSVRWVHLKNVRTNGELAITLRDISDARAHVEELERRGNEDALTGLPNRHWVYAYLPQAVEHAAAVNSMLALLFVDLDGFKRVNDTLGHAAGDELLCNAARRLKEAVRPHDYVARLGGDEFVVIIEQVAHKSDVAHVVERIQNAFQQAFRLSQGSEPVGASIGISMFPSDGADANTLLEHADIAMYSVKTAGKGGYRFFDQKFYDALRHRLEQEAELRQAIAHDQLVLYYQPRVDLSTGATSSMEALVRWAHPTKGLISPLDFIPLAEETGLILSLGELVIDKVCAQLAQWARTGQQMVPVSVNVSSRQFNEADTAKIVSLSLARHHIDARLLEVEITESSMMGDDMNISIVLSAIRRMGIKLLVDDFGTGYSSLSQLQRLDFDVLKVDRAFTTELGRTEKGNVFFKAIITMAHALGMRVVAEGVENERQVNILKSLECDEIQGFYISEPLPPSSMQPILPKWNF